MRPTEVQSLSPEDLDMLARYVMAPSQILCAVVHAGQVLQGD